MGRITSFGHVMIRGNACAFSFCPFTIASRMLGWSEPRLTKQYVTPACENGCECPIALASRAESGVWESVVEQ
jgi:hypothetical protein